MRDPASVTRSALRGLSLALVAAALLATVPAWATSRLDAWQWDPSVQVARTTVAFPSHSPFSLSDVGGGPDLDPREEALGVLFMPPHASLEAPVPAVVMLHGSSGVLEERELTYGRQLAAMGVAALVVDAFGARRERAQSFVDRLINITETMLIADAYAALRYLAQRPDIDEDRVALIGFSYGAMATTYALYAQVAARFAPEGPRFAGHVAFYGPCVVRFEDSRTTGAPLLMLAGARDEIIDPDRCAAVAEELRAGGSAVETIVYADAVHQWDGRFVGPRRIGRTLAACDLTVGRDDVVRDNHSGFAMRGPFTRKLILALCVGRDGYLIGRDDRVRERSNRDLGQFLAHLFGDSAPRQTEDGMAANEG